MTAAASRMRCIRAGVLVDGTGAPAERDAAVLIQGDRIAAVGPAASVSLPTEPTVPLIELPLSTLMPGLIDAHHHVSYCGHLGMQQLEWPATLEDSAVCAGANATLALRSGVTSALDVGCRGAIGVSVKRAVEMGIINGPTLRVSGQILSTVGGALDIWPSTMQLEPRTRLTALVSGTDDIVRTIREQAKSGVDNIKLQITRSSVQAGSAFPSTFTGMELATAVRTAHENGCSVAAHAEGPAAVRLAIDAGFDTIHHLSFADDSVFDLASEHPDTRLVYTLGVYDAILARGREVGYPDEPRRRIQRLWKPMTASLRLAHERGVPFAAGSDCGGKVHPHGGYARDLLVYVRDCGLSSEEAIRAGTSRAAEAAGFGDVGELRAGRRADLIAVRGDLTKDLASLGVADGVELVIKAGVLVVDRRAEQVAI